MTATYTQSFTNEILSGDQESSWSIIKQAVDEGKKTDYIFHHIITPSMVEIGALWQENKISVADEHLATATCDFILARYKFEILQPRINQKDSVMGKALFFCVENEEHDLGIRMTAQLFEEEGYNVRMMGANLPLEYVKEMASVWMPDVVGVSASMLAQGKKVPSYIQSFMETLDGTELLVGGRYLSLQAEEALQSINHRVTMVRSPEDLSKWMEKDRKRGEED
ncbi:cobalamin-dependent protein [Jeotgalibacillus sp. ET6]|uniref:cobalamin B12-binding domain-containing protein n=1 Tax=Jeotgalibacillus sp. ET6 TaxID=3037260 RepID=UPI00241841F6|nr:cobalamin-dependent protein [Jeotgalibacillus sp. ET6]MDG5473259.1 cobalamin-dependent protein [Jeotgalibacillus sp. ET6]